MTGKRILVYQCQANEWRSINCQECLGRGRIPLPGLRVERCSACMGTGKVKIIVTKTWLYPEGEVKAE